MEVLYDAAAHIQAQARRIAELEAELIGCRKKAIEEAAKLVADAFDEDGFGIPGQYKLARSIRSLIPPEKVEATDGDPR